MGPAPPQAPETREVLLGIPADRVRHRAHRASLPANDSAPHEVRISFALSLLFMLPGVVALNIAHPFASWSTLGLVTVATLNLFGYTLWESWRGAIHLGAIRRRLIRGSVMLQDATAPKDADRSPAAAGHACDSRDVDLPEVGPTGAPKPSRRPPPPRPPRSSA